MYIHDAVLVVNLGIYQIIETYANIIYTVHLCHFEHFILHMLSFFIFVTLDIE